MKGRCVHCLQYFESLTRDHVLPRSWYPDTTPGDLEKWKIPSCLPCNTLHGRNENELLLRLGLSVDPNDPRSSGILEKALRGLDPDASRNIRDRKARARQLLRVLTMLFTSEGGPLPPVSDLRQSSMLHHVTLWIDTRSIELLMTKIVRGITYIKDQRFIEPPYDIEIYCPEGARPESLTEALSLAQHHACGPGISILRAIADDGLTSVCEITIWGSRRAVAVVFDSRSAMFRRSEHTRVILPGWCPR